MHGPILPCILQSFSGVYTASIQLNAWHDCCQEYLLSIIDTCEFCCKQSVYMYEVENHRHGFKDFSS